MNAVAKLPHVFSGAIAAAIRTLINDVPGAAAKVDQHQSNGAWCVHQLRVQLEGDDTIYRVIVAPENAPVMIGSVPAETHFAARLRSGL